MKQGIRRGLFTLALTAAAVEGHAATDNGFSLSVLVSGAPRAEYAARGTVYVEAVKGAPYALRLTNPLPYRVAVALSVDGLNSIDARHTDPSSARKWVIEPYGALTISGWQVSGSAARSFFFTGERQSYGALLGRTENLGVIEAVFFRERLPLPVPVMEMPAPPEPPVAGAGEGLRRDASSPRAAEKQAGALSNDSAATGMGGRHEHSVMEVGMDLEPGPFARVRVRYEFRPQLVALGVLPRDPDPLSRREHAAGFSGYCPEADR